MTAVLKSDVCAKTAAGVLAANRIKVQNLRRTDAGTGTFLATRYYNCNAGIIVTASHNPANTTATKPTVRTDAR